MKQIVLVSILLICIFTGLIAAKINPPKTVYASKNGQAKLECILQGSASICEFSSIGNDGTSNVMLTSYSPEKVNVPFDYTGVMMTLEDDLGQGRCTLILDNVQPEISGRYTCKINDLENKKHTQNFNLIVLVMPTLKEIYYDGNAIKNGTIYELSYGFDDPKIISLEVRAERGFPAATGQWEIDGQFEQPNENTTVLDDGSYKTTVSRVTFQIWQDEAKPERSLTYISFHKAYPGEKSFRKISIGYPYGTRHAEIKREYFKLPDGKVTQLTCIADGIPKPSVEWQWAFTQKGPYVDYTENLPETKLNDQINATYEGFYMCCAKNIRNNVCVKSLSVEATGTPPPLVMPTLSEIIFNGIPIKNGSDFELPNGYANKFITLEARAEHGFPPAEAEWDIVGHLGEYVVETNIVNADMGLKTTISLVTFEISEEETRPERTVIFISRHPHYFYQELVRMISIGYPRSTTKSEIVKQTFSAGSDDEMTLLACVANGSPKPEFVWEYAANFNDSYELFTDMITASELKDEITTTIKGFYRCLAKNPNNVDWVKSLSVDVEGKDALRKPSIFSYNGVKLNANHRYHIDDLFSYKEIELRCMVPAINIESNIRWDSKPIGTEFTVNETEKTDNGKMYSSTLLTSSINPFEVKPERTFVCVVTSTNEILTEMVTVGFKYKTRKVRSFASSEVNSKETRRKLLYCKADGIPEPKFQWKKKINNDFVNYKTGAHIVVSDQGTYQCFARNKINEPFEWIKSVNDDIVIRKL